MPPDAVFAVLTAAWGLGLVRDWVWIAGNVFMMSENDSVPGFAVFNRGWALDLARWRFAPYGNVVCLYSRLCVLGLGTVPNLVHGADTEPLARRTACP